MLDCIVTLVIFYLLEGIIYAFHFWHNLYPKDRNLGRWRWEYLILAWPHAIVDSIWCNMPKDDAERRRRAGY